MSHGPGSRHGIARWGKRAYGEATGLRDGAAGRKEVAMARETDGPSRGPAGRSRWVLAGVVATVVLAAAPGRAGLPVISVNALGERANFGVFEPALDGSGRIAAYASGATNLAAPCAGNVQVYVRDVAAGVTECVSVSTAGVAGDGPSHHPVLSRDGRLVAFDSEATNLDPACPLGGVFVRDRLAGTTECVSVASGGSRLVFGERPSMSADGRLVAFQSDIISPGTVPPCGYGFRKVLIRDRVAGTTTCVSVGPSGEVYGGNPSLSADGRFMLLVGPHFQPPPCVTPADFNSAFAFYVVRDLQAGTTTSCLNLDRDGVPFQALESRLSRDGRTVAFLVRLPDLPHAVPAPCPDPAAEPGAGLGARSIEVVLLRELATGTVTCVLERPRALSNGISLDFDVKSYSLRDDAGALAIVSYDISIFCEASVYLLRPRAAPPEDRDCLSPREQEIRVGREVALAGDGSRAAFTFGGPGPDQLVLAEVLTPAAPNLRVAANGSAFRPGETLVLTAVLTPGLAPPPVDAYVVLRTPANDQFWFVAGGVAHGFLPEPLATGFTPFPFQGEILRYTLTGAEPIGDYYIEAVLVGAGTLVSDLERTIFRILP